MAAPPIRASEFGIGCEACHGPGDPHARANRNPPRRYLGAPYRTTEGPRAAVVPSALEPKAASQVCGQCHGVYAYASRADEWSVNSAGHAYRPGQDLLETRFLVRPSKDMESPRLRTFAANNRSFMSGSFWSDGMVRVSGRA